MSDRVAEPGFFKTARELWGDKYDYSKAKYVTLETPITIICPKHGRFKMAPSRHLHHETGCNKCLGELPVSGPIRNRWRTMTFDDFVVRATARHKGAYTYPEQPFEGKSSNVRIVCEKHGEFTQLASSHLAGTFCPQCSASMPRRGLRLTTADFIRRAEQLHGRKYDYSRVVYVTGKKDVEIICPKHGVFRQSPTVHLAGSGCRKCALANFMRVGNRVRPQSELIAEFRQTHGDRYDYSKVVYRGGRYPVTIICPEHGEFQQSAASHRNGSHCPKCAYRARNERMTQTKRERRSGQQPRATGS